jgi:hypothetical protein
MWDSKPALIKKEVAILDNLHGGLGMIDLDSIVQSKQITLIYQIMHSETQRWNAIGQYWLQSL